MEGRGSSFSKAAQMCEHARVALDLNPSSRENHPQARPRRVPAFDVLAAQVGLDDLGAAGIRGHERVAGRRVDQERLVEASLDPRRASPPRTRQRHAGPADLVEQRPHIRPLDHPRRACEAGAGQRERQLGHLLGHPVQPHEVARDLAGRRSRRRLAASRAGAPRSRRGTRPLPGRSAWHGRSRPRPPAMPPRANSPRSLSA